MPVVKISEEAVRQFRPDLVDRIVDGYVTLDEPLSFVQKAQNFVMAAVKHVTKGMPRASDEEIARRFAICLGCEFYKSNSCTKCGCPVYREKKFISKLAWADQSCPVGKWGNSQ